MQIYDHAIEAAGHLKAQLPESLQTPKIGIICGSGLGGIANTVEHSPQIQVGYADIPHFPQSTVPGHAGKLLFGLLGKSKTPVAIMVGRLHFYEGHSIQDTTFPIRVLKLLGISTILMTNAAGGLNPNYRVGDLVILNDHLNFLGLSGYHPLRGPNIEPFGPRFPPLSDAYDLDLRRNAHWAWRDVKSSNRTLHEGTYAFVSGPSYETRAECRLLRNLGADLVGMSTVPEVIVARHSGIRVLAISLVTNIAVLNPGPLGNDESVQTLNYKALKALDEVGKADHEDVLEAGHSAAADMELLIHELVRIIL